MANLLRGARRAALGRAKSPMPFSAGADNAPLFSLSSDLAALNGALRVSRQPRSQSLHKTISEFLQQFASTMGTEAAAAVVEGRQHWTRAAPELVTPLLAVGEAALATDPDLTRRVATAILEGKKNSRGAWRLTARACEKLGDYRMAIEAHERYLEQTKEDNQRAHDQVRLLGTRLTAEDGMAEALRDPRFGDTAVSGAPEDVWVAALQAESAGDWPEARRLLAGVLRNLVAEGASSQTLGPAADEFVAKLTQHEAGEIAGYRDFIAPYVTYRRLLGAPPVDIGAVRDLTVMAANDFRNYLAGKSICLIANSERAATSGLGTEIDSYDLVVRFNSFLIKPEHTGARTDIHATIHLHKFNWDKKVDVRIVFSGNGKGWGQSVRRHLVPGAQRAINDKSLRWPVVDPNLVGDEHAPPIPTSGFNMLRLLDHFDVNPRIDLFGFDFYESAPFRLPEAMALPVAAAHSYSIEKDWVMAKATQVTDDRISLR